MPVDVIQASEKLIYAFARINARADELPASDKEHCNLMDIKRELEHVESYLNEMKASSLS